MNAPATKNALSGADKFNLQLLVKEEYAKMGLYDKEFAAWASEKLGLTVTSGNVQGARECFGIMSTRDVARSTVPTDVTAQLTDLRNRLARLEERIEVYFKGCRKESAQ